MKGQAVATPGKEREKAVGSLGNRMLQLVKDERGTIYAAPQLLTTAWLAALTAYMLGLRGALQSGWAGQGLAWIVAGAIALLAGGAAVVWAWREEGLSWDGLLVGVLMWVVLIVVAGLTL